MSVGIAAQVEDLLKSERFYRIVTVSAQVYSLQENSAEWRELSPCPVLVHLFNDAAENVAKLVALHNMELIISHCPLLPSFTVHCPSKKFLHVMSNKYDPHSPVYGFGFSNACELETLFLHLRRLKASSSLAAAAVGIPPSMVTTRRPFSSTSRPTTPVHLNTTVAPFSPGPRFHPANPYKDSSPYHNRHMSGPILPPYSNSSSSSALYEDFMMRRQHQQPSMMAHNDTSPADTEEDEEAVHLQPYFSYGEGDGGYGGLEEPPQPMLECELESEEVAGDVMDDVDADDEEERTMDEERMRASMATVGERIYTVTRGLYSSGGYSCSLENGVHDGALASSTPLSTPICVSPPTNVGDCVDGDRNEDMLNEQQTLDSTPRRASCSSAFYDDVFFSPQKHFSNFVLGCDLRATAAGRGGAVKQRAATVGGAEQSDSTPSLTTLISHFTPLSLDSHPTPFPSSITGENPAGVIGSPVKGIGGNKSHPTAIV